MSLRTYLALLIRSIALFVCALFLAVIYGGRSAQPLLAAIIWNGLVLGVVVFGSGALSRAILGTLLRERNAAWIAFALTSVLSVALLWNSALGAVGAVGLGALDKVVSSRAVAV